MYYFCTILQPFGNSSGASAPSSSCVGVSLAVNPNSPNWLRGSADACISACKQSVVASAATGSTASRASRAAGLAHCRAIPCKKAGNLYARVT
eukprot:866186-Amphidinium_carterae.1